MSEQCLPRHVRVLYCVVALTVGAAAGGCGGGGDEVTVNVPPPSASPPPSPSPSPSPVPAPPPAPTPSPGPSPAPGPSPSPAPSPSSAPAITQQPADAAVAEGASATFSAAASAGATLRWQRRSGSGAAWADIGGATAARYTTPATYANDDDAQFRMVASNADGTTASAPATLDVAPRTWRAATLVHPSGGFGNTDPHVEFDAAGNAMAVWSSTVSTSDGDFGSVFASRYVDGAWQEPVSLAEYIFASASDARLGVAADGSAIAVWTQSGEENIVWVRRYAPDSGWGPPARLSAGFASRPAIDLDATGGAIVVWPQSTAAGEPADLWAARYVVGSGWQPAALAETQGGSAETPEVALDGDGDAMLVWRQSLGGQLGRAWARRYSVASGWQTETMIDNGSETAGNPRVAVRANGDAFAVWSMHDLATGRFAQVWSNRFAVASGWAGAERIDDRIDETAGADARIVVDAQGDASALWTELAGLPGAYTGASVWVNRHIAGSGWGAAQRVSAEGQAEALGVDARGNAMALWTEFREEVADQPYSLRARRHVVGSGWNAPVTLDTVGPEDSFSASLAFATSGLGLAVWAQQKYFRSGDDVLAAEFE
jgi:hypothetical protein